MAGHHVSVGGGNSPLVSAAVLGHCSHNGTSTDIEQNLGDGSSFLYTKALAMLAARLRFPFTAFCAGGVKSALARPARS